MIIPFADESFVIAEIKILYVGMIPVMGEIISVPCRINSVRVGAIAVPYLIFLFVCLLAD